MADVEGQNSEKKIDNKESSKEQKKEQKQDDFDLLSQPRKQLLLLIMKSMQSGRDEKSIQSDLIRAGWSKSMVKELLEESRNSADVMKAGFLSHKGERSAVVFKDSTIVRFDNVSKTFGETVVLNKVNLDIKEGEIFGIIGLSGSGKSTMLNLIIGFYHADEGKVLFRTPGAEPFQMVLAHPDEVKTMMGFSPQDASFYANLTAEENLFYFGSLYNISRHNLRQNVYALLDLVELSKSRKTLAKNLSGGMQRRLSIACSLIHEPKILVLDEPTADLDPVIRKDMWDLIRKIHDNGTTVILTSHLLTELENLCNRVAIIHNGQVLRLGTPNEIKNLYTQSQEIIIETMMGEYTNIIQTMKKMDLPLKRVTVEGNRLYILSESAEEVLHKVLDILEKRKDTILDISLNKPSLEEVFENLVKQKPEPEEEEKESL
jgi:ABC-2 type transport system ATP-binding protein